MKSNINATEEVIDWLLEGDPSIHWQAQRDLLHAPRRMWEQQRRQMARHGWARQLLNRQDLGGTWGGGLYTPKWTSTTYTLLLLRDMGLPPGDERARRGCGLILEKLVRPAWEFPKRGRTNRDGRGDREARDDNAVCASGCTCMAGMFLALGAYFEMDDPKLAPLAEHVLGEQMSDGGWNCRCRNGKGAVHGSFHTTFNVLDGVREAIAHGIGPVARLRAAEARAIEFMLQHRLFKSDKTGRVINPVFTKLSFPRWHYDVLRGLEYIRTTSFIKDKRLDHAFDLLQRQRRPDGRWPLQHVYRGEVFFTMERPGQPSRWNTLRALRCLKARGRSAD